MEKAGKTENLCSEENFEKRYANLKECQARSCISNVNFKANIKQTRYCMKIAIDQL